MQWTVQAFPLLCFIGIVDWEMRSEGVGFGSMAPVVVVKDDVGSSKDGLGAVNAVKLCCEVYFSIGCFYIILLSVFQHYSHYLKWKVLTEIL